MTEFWRFIEVSAAETEKKIQFGLFTLKYLSFFPVLQMGSWI